MYVDPDWVGDAVTTGAAVRMGVASCTQFGVGVGVAVFVPPFPPPELTPRSSTGSSEHPAQASTRTTERMAAKSSTCLFIDKGISI